MIARTVELVWRRRRRRSRHTTPGMASAFFSADILLPLSDPKYE
jgi:hypothetical protein